MQYVLKDIRWYYTNKGFVPYIVNKDKTKIKILTTEEIYPINKIDDYVKIEACGKTFKIRNKRKDKGRFEEYKIDEIMATLKRATGESGIMVAPVDVFNVYYFKHAKITDNVVYEWLNSSVVTTERIKYITETINKAANQNKKDCVDDISKNSRNF